MGGSQSAPRKITLENPEESVIRITEDVVERLQDANRPSNSRQATEHQTSEQTDAVIPSSAIFVTSQQIRREVNNEIEKNNTYWENRLKMLQEGHRKIAIELEEEYNKAVKEVNETLGKHVTTTASDLESCKQSRNSIVECYNSNKNRPLLCSEHVQKFNDCVSSQMNLVLKAK